MCHHRARLGLSDAFIEALAGHGIPYDRNEGGEYFQLYTANFGEGSFFEIVERRGAYAGYGAVNAPFRIAAQKRALRPEAIPQG